MIKLLPLLFLFLCTYAAQANEPHKATVREIVDGDTVFITPSFKDGDEIRLVGIQAPKLPLGRNNFPIWPLAQESKIAIEALSLGKPVTLTFGGARRDRYGRWLAHLNVQNNDNTETWIQGELLRRGLARVYSFPDNRSRVSEMLALEREARQSQRGIWALPYYAIRNPDAETLGDQLGTFQLVEGRIVDAADVKGTVYLNFGSDWRTDFTISISKKSRRLFDKASLDPAAWSGRSVRVRGWLTKRNGPMIRATHPEQIELLER